MPKEHEASCPRLQFWDAGEGECPCTCGTQPVDEYIADCAARGVQQGKAEFRDWAWKEFDKQREAGQREMLEKVREGLLGKTMYHNVDTELRIKPVLDELEKEIQK